MVRLVFVFALFQLLAQPTYGADNQRFECLGIGGGGRLFEPAINPHNSRIHYASCDMGPFYVSKDGGDTWIMISQTAMSMCLSGQPGFHPTQKSWVYLPYRRHKKNEFRVSKDWGMTWETLCSKAPWGKDVKSRTAYYTGMNHIEVDPTDGKLILVSHNDGLFRSSDGGKSFVLCQGVSKNARASYISPKPVNGSRPCFSATYEGLWTSTDNAKTWQKLTCNLPTSKLWSFKAAYNPKTKQINCYAGLDGECYYSTDSGRTFSKSTGLPKTIYARISLATTHPNIAYTACLGNYREGKGSTWGVWRTSDCGKTWKKIFRPWKFENQNISTSWVHLELGKSWGGFSHGLGVCPTDPDILSYTNAMEMYISKNAGESWEYVASKYHGPNKANPEKSQPWEGRGLESALPTDCVFDPFLKDRCFLTYGDVGMIISDDHGRSWRKASKGIPRKWVNRMWSLFPDPAHKGVYYSASSNSHEVIQEKGKSLGRTGGVQKSTDHGISWKTIGTGLPQDKLCITNLVIDLTSDTEKRTLYCTYPTKGVYRSTDNGETWVLKDNGLGRKDNKNFYGLKVDRKGAVYALSVGLRDNRWKFRFGNGGLWKSVDAGDSWVELTKGISLANPMYFNVDPDDSNHIFVATTQAPSKEAAGLWETKDSGKTWKQIITRNTFGEDKELYGYIHSGDVCFNPKNGNHVFYSTKTHGLWYSLNRGKTWKRRKAIPPLASGKVIFDPWLKNTMYVCSRGLWKGPVE